MLGLAPGGSVDRVTRLIAQSLSQRLGQQFVIENRPGAAGSIAMEVVARAPADGYTLLVVLAANAINATLRETPEVNLIRDIALIGGMVRLPNVMVVHPDLPANTVPEFIAYAKANPGKLSFASSGNGTSLHIVAELFKMMTGVSMLHVTYRGGAPALVDLLARRVHVMFDTIPEAIGYIRDGRLRALAVTTAARSPALPDVPPMRDFLPGFEAGSWWGLGAPRNTPLAVINALNAVLNECLSDPGFETQLTNLGATPLVLSPEEFHSFVEAETEKWATVVKFSGAKQW